MVSLGGYTTLGYVHRSHLAELLLTSGRTVHNGHPVLGVGKGREKLDVTTAFQQF